MRFAATDASADVISHDEMVSITDPRRMTQAELRRLGMPHVVYLRSGTINGETEYAIHAADGTAMAVAEDVSDAIELASAGDMTLVAVH
jgi:hypothetical protein